LPECGQFLAKYGQDDAWLEQLVSGFNVLPLERLQLLLPRHMVAVQAKRAMHNK
jgi:hypothetical protein